MKRVLVATILLAGCSESGCNSFGRGFGLGAFSFNDRQRASGSVCGNGTMEGAEACDDGDLDAGDGCSGSCTIESGYQCTIANPSVCTPICGDGIIIAPETCDDDGTAAGDGCSATCTIEDGYTCSGTPSVCRSIIHSFTWDFAYWGSDLVDPDWIEHGGGGAGEDLARPAGSAPTIDVSTTGLTSAALPAALVDNAVTFVGAANNGFRNAGAFTWDGSTTWHVRQIVRPTLGANTNRYWRHLVSSTSLTYLRNSTATTIVLEIRDDADGSNYISTITGLTSGGGNWWLLDICYDPTGAPGSFGRVRFYINGDDLSPADDGESIQPASGGDFGLAGDQAGQNTAAQTLLFFGKRAGACPSLATHQADAASLGVDGVAP